MNTNNSDAKNLFYFGMGTNSVKLLSVHSGIGIGIPRFLGIPNIGIPRNLGIYPEISVYHQVL